MGILTREKVHEALSIQKNAGRKNPIGQILLDLGYVTEKDLKLALAFQLGMQYVEIQNLDVPDEIINLLDSSEGDDLQGIAY